MPSTPVDLEADGRPALLQSTERADADELYTEQEKALSEYLKLHPMLSLRVYAHSNPQLPRVYRVRLRAREATNHRTLQLVGDLVEQSSIPTRELEVVGKAYDDAYLRAPDVARGERPCCMGDRCICVWLARWRYGDDTEKAFVGAEFLLPSQRRAFDESGALPAIPGKCLVCTRYATTFLYRLARSDPAFRGNVLRVPVTAFGNAMLEGDSVPTHASLVNSEDGYRRDALLFVDEAWADSPAARGADGLLPLPALRQVCIHALHLRRRSRHQTPAPHPNKRRREHRGGLAFSPASVFEAIDGCAEGAGLNLAQSQQLADVPADVAIPAAAAAAAAAAKPQPRPRPLHDSFESAGVHAALKRLWAQLSAEAVERQRLQTWPERLIDGPPPAWVFDHDFAHAVRARDAHRGGDLQRVLDLVRSFRRLRERLDALRLRKPVDPEPEQPMAPPRAHRPLPHRRARAPLLRRGARSPRGARVAPHLLDDRGALLRRPAEGDGAARLRRLLRGALDLGARRVRRHDRRPRRRNLRHELRR